MNEYTLKDYFDQIIIKSWTYERLTDQRRTNKERIQTNKVQTNFKKQNLKNKQTLDNKIPVKCSGTKAGQIMQAYNQALYQAINI